MGTDSERQLSLPEPERAKPLPRLWPEVQAEWIGWPKNDNDVGRDLEPE